MPDVKRNALERGRAKFAYERAKNVKDNFESISGNYKSYVKKMPMLIKTNGLGAALAFIYSKQEKSDTQKKAYGYKLLFDNIAEWLKKDEKQLLEYTENADLVAKIIALDSPSYRMITVEVLAFLNWLRRFAEGLIEKEEENGE